MTRGAASSNASKSSTRTSSASRPARRCRSTPSSACCSRRRGRRSRTPALRCRRGVDASRRCLRRHVDSTSTKRACFAATTAIDFYMTTGSGRYAASGRLSHLSACDGPSMTIDTACSSSLVAVHLACQSLRAGESELAIAGGANVILEPQHHDRLLPVPHDGARRPLQVRRRASRRLRPQRRRRRRGAQALRDAVADGRPDPRQSFAAARSTTTATASGSFGTPSRAGQEDAAAQRRTATPVSIRRRSSTSRPTEPERGPATRWSSAPSARCSGRDGTRAAVASSAR